MDWIIWCNHCDTGRECGHAYWHKQRCIEYAHHLAIIEDARRG